MPDYGVRTHVLLPRLPLTHRAMHDALVYGVRIWGSVFETAPLFRPFPYTYPVPEHHTPCDAPARLACLIHAASVHPEPGSNSDNR